MDGETKLNLDPGPQLVTVNDPSPSVSVIWDQAVQNAPIETAPGPTIASRAYALMHTAIYDAWASYDDAAAPAHLDPADVQPGADASESDVATAMSLAADRVLGELFPEQTQFADDALAELGVARPDGAAAEGSPAAVGRAAGDAVMAARRIDGSNQVDDYAGHTNYAPVNPHPGEINEIAHWTPESVPIDPEDSDPEQSFLTPQWKDVDTFGMDRADAMRPPAPEPFFMPGVDADLDMDSETVTLANGETRPVSEDLVGTVINPGFIEQAEKIVDVSANLTDRQKLQAEFWEDAAGTSFPPGTSMTFGQFVSARDDHTRAEDARMFMALGNAVADAGAATWDAKVHHDYVRPVRAIRDLGELGLIGEPGTDALTGETGHVVEAWAGPDAGVTTVLADNFITYQTPGSDPSPPFAEYTSGHSGFSSAGAEVLRLMTGDDHFGASVTFEPGESRFEPGQTPSEPVTLSWDTFSEAAEGAGRSRIYGGIHFDDADFAGRELGRNAAREVWNEAQTLFNGGESGGTGTPDALPETVSIIVGLYQAGLGRLPDRGGLNFWIDEAQGETDRLPGIADSFLQSGEFARNFEAQEPLSDRDFVMRLFENIDRPSPGDAAIEPWLSDLESGTSRGDLLADFARSDMVAEATTYTTGLSEVSDGEWWFG